MSCASTSERVVSDLRSGLNPDSRHQRAYRTHSSRRGRPRSFTVRYALGLRILAGALSGQPDQWWQSTLGQNSRREKSRAMALRIASQSLHRSQSFLGDYYRRMRAKMGTPKAITAAAHKLARIIFHLLGTRQAYDESIFSKHELQHRHRSELRLRNHARRLGFDIVPASATSSGVSVP